MKLIIDNENLEELCWRDSTGQWWQKSGECNMCGACCRVEGYCEYLKDNLCQIRVLYPGIRNLACFIGPTPDIQTPNIKEKCSYKWKKVTLKEIL